MNRLLFTVLLALVISPAIRAEAPEEPDVLDRIRTGIDDGMAFLIRTQNKDGSWGSPDARRPYQILAPVPGGLRSFASATSSLALMAIWGGGGSGEEIEAARQKGLTWVLANARAKRSQGNVMYNVWALGYGLQCLSRCLLNPRPWMDAEAVRARAAELVKHLAVYQGVDGGWSYYDFFAHTFKPSGDSMSFTTSMVLLALYDARRAGINVPEPMVKKGVVSLSRTRTPEGSYVYSMNWRYQPQSGINRHGGSLTRTPGNNLALFHLGHTIKEPDLEKGVRVLVEKRAFGRMALRRPRPHSSWNQVSGYFYLFGYFYAGECCRILPEATVAKYREPLARDILYTMQPDGSFWDYPLYGYHKPYGTAYAVMALRGLLGPAKAVER